MPRVKLEFFPHDFSLDVPEGWTLSNVIFAGPSRDPASAAEDRSARPFQRNVIVTLEQVLSEETPYDYFERQEKGLREAGVESGLVGLPEEVEFERGRKGLLLERVVVSHEGERVRQVQLMTIKETSPSR